MTRRSARFTGPRRADVKAFLALVAEARGPLPTLAEAVAELDAAGCPVPEAVRLRQSEPDREELRRGELLAERTA